MRLCSGIFIEYGSLLRDNREEVVILLVKNEHNYFFCLRGIENSDIFDVINILISSFYSDNSYCQAIYVYNYCC
jgi:hypothetical protein